MSLAVERVSIRENSVVGWAKRSVPTKGRSLVGTARKNAPLPTLHVIPVGRNPLWRGAGFNRESRLPLKPAEKRHLAGVHKGRKNMFISIRRRELSMFRPGLLASAIMAGLALTSPAHAQST